MLKKIYKKIIAKKNSLNTKKRLIKTLIDGMLLYNRDIQYEIEKINRDTYKIKLYYLFSCKELGTKCGLAFKEKIEDIPLSTRIGIQAIKRLVYYKIEKELKVNHFGPSGISFLSNRDDDPEKYVIYMKI